MLYEQYRSKMAKVADVLGAMHKYRILIICVCAFIAALTATLLGISGTVFDTAECPSEITAGEEIPYRAGAIFGSVEYEFCVNGSDIWTAEIPARPGEYLVRSFSKDIAGKPRYGKAHLFTVLPRTVTVTADCASAVYGDLPPVKADLLYSDRVTCSAFTYSDYASATATVEPVASAVTVYDEEGNDVTYTYNIQTQSSQLDFIKREITVSLSPYSADYDGKEHPKIPYTGYEIDSGTPLAEGDFEEVYVSVFQTQAGEYANDIYFKIYKKTEAGNVEVTSNYDIKVSSGTLTVNKRTLEITTADFTAVYDGLEKYENGFTLAESSLAALNDAGHSITVTGNTVQKNAGEYENELQFIITDENGNDVTSNYALNITYGSFKILPRPLTCSTTSAEWYYDGTTHSDNTGFVILKNSSSSYASEDEVAYFIEGSEMHVKDVADSCQNMLQIGVFNTATGEDVTDNYAVNYVYGELTVIPRPIKVTVDGEEWEYDGEAHSSNKHTVSCDEDLFDSALIEGHTVTARGLKTITDVGSVQNSIDFGIYEGDEIVTDNYDIKWNNGEITVIPRKITVGAISHEKVYDGTPLNSYGVEVVSENGLVEGHSISGETEGTVTNAETVYCSITDANTVTVYDENGEDISYNYEIENITEGTLTVLPREITVTAGTAQKVYDGTPLTCPDYSVTSAFETAIVEGQNITVTTFGSVTDAESGINSVLDYLITLDETDVTDNYLVTLKDGVLTVLKRRAMIVTASTDEENKLIYDASPQCLAEFTEVEEDNIDTGIIKSHTAKIEEIFYATEAGTYENKLQFEIWNGEEEVTKNYDLSIGYGKLTISPRPITVTTDDNKDFVYDGTPKYHLNCSADNLVEGHSWQADTEADYTTVTNAEEKNNKFTVNIFDGETDVTDNYTIEYEYGKIKVNPRHVTVTTSSNLELVYDATAQSYLECSADNLVQGHSAVADKNKTYTTLTDVGTADNEFEVNIFDGETYVTDNYTIEYEYGTIEVTPRPITLKTATREWIFDGAYHSDGAVEDTKDQLIDELPYGHTLAYGGSLPQIKEVGEVTNKFDLYVLNAEGQDITSNYKISYEYGTLKINPLPVKVTANSDSKVYDSEALTNDGFTVTANGYTAEFNRLTYRFEATVAGSITDVGEEVNEVSNLKVYDGETEVNLNNFVITYVNGALTITPRPVTITIGSAEKVYDGEPLECKKYEVTSTYSPALVSDHKEQVTIKGSLTDVGTENNTVDEDNIKILSGENDVTDNYEIKLVKGTLTVTKRPITVTTASKTDFIYDGTQHSCLEYEITDGTLVEGHTHRVDKTEIYTRVMVVCQENNVMTVIILDGERDVSANYQITYKYGKIKVNPRPIIIKTGSDDKIYDGTELYLEQAEISENSEYGFVDGDTFEYVSHASIIEVKLDGDGNVIGIDNAIGIVIKRGNTAITDNYDIKWEYGTLTVTPRPVYVFAIDSEKVYDGTTDIPAESKKFDSSYNGDGEFGIVEGQEIYSGIIGAEGEIGSVVGEYSIKIDGEVVIKDGNRDVTFNYTVTALEQPYATLNIIPRPIIIKTGSDEKIYDGIELYLEYAAISENSKYNLVGYDIFEYTSHTNITDVMLDADGTVTGKENVLGIIIRSGETNVTENYDISEWEYGTLKITPCPLYVTTYSDEKEYDGTPLTYDDYLAVPLEGHTAQITVTGTQTEVGTSDNTVDTENFTVTTLSGEEVNRNNYYIVPNYGTLTVTQGKLTIRTASDEKVYDGTRLTNGYYEITNGTLPDSFTLEVTVTGSQTLAGYSENSFTWKIFNGQEDVTDYFEVTPEAGTLTVTPRPVTVTTGSASKMYDGTPLKYDKWEITDGSLVEGHTAEVYVFGEITEVGTVPNVFEMDIHDEEGNSVRASYYVTADFGMLTITADTETSDDDTVWIRVKSDIGGSVYLRQYSVGDYVSGMTWSYAPQYEDTLSYNGGSYGYNYLTSFALGDTGNTGRVDIELTALHGAHLLPYYAKTDNPIIMTSDTVYYGDTDVYTVNYTVYDYLASIKPNTSVFTTEEAQYSRFVKENYLTVDDNTRSFLDGIISENHLSKDDIVGVAEYIKGTATYDLEQDYTQLESSENVIISFLRDSEYGVCRHFAMAGTMLYRALGIPARYTVGFARNLKAGEWAEFKEGHAWVELYIDGLGWVMVEVTPSASMGGGDEGGGEGEGGNGQHTYTVNLKPKTAVKTYDGTAITATEILPDLTLVRLLELGYYYDEITFDGSQTEVGESESIVTGFTLYTPEGEVFTDVGYIYKKGLLKVVEEEIVTIHTYVKNKEYDGKPMYFGKDEYYATFASGLTGYSVEVSGLEKVGFTEIGILTPEQLKAKITVTVYDGQGKNVTEQFYVDCDPDFMITPIAVTIATNNVSKEYDGEELADESDPQLTFGSFMAGHRIEVTSRPSITDPGDIENSILFIIVDENGNDVSAYYDITKNYGKLTVIDGD